MGVLSSLVSQAQPALFGNGVTAAGTAGATWLWQFVDLNDTAGDPIDLTGVTGTCKIVDKDDHTTVITTLDFDGNSDGTFSVGKDEDATAPLTPGTYCWWLTLDDTTDVIQVWGGSASKFSIREA